MPRQHQMSQSKKTLGIIAVVVLIIAAAIGYRLGHKPEPEPQSKKMLTPIKPLKPQAIIDYDQLEKDQKLKTLMQQRKAKYGLGKGIDMITKSDESFKVGSSTVAMQEILDKIRIKSGDIVEKDIQAGGKTSSGEIKDFGIYVVQPNDNIWNIHFKFLKDYFDHKGVTLAPLADEPGMGGQSSGIGKILKFSENTVHIYNLKDQKLDIDLNLIIPLSKIVVYNMDQIFKLLDLIDYERVNHIQFDGETLWIPSQ